MNSWDYTKFLSLPADVVKAIFSSANRAQKVQQAQHALALAASPLPEAIRAQYVDPSRRLTPHARELAGAIKALQQTQEGRVLLDHFAAVRLLPLADNADLLDIGRRDGINRFIDNLLKLASLE